MTPSSNVFDQHRIITFFAIAAFLVMPLFPAGASDTTRNLQPPTEKTITPGAETSAEKVTASGTIKKQGVTSYMYGTHVLVNETGKTLYALKSHRVDLDVYVGKRVTVCGELVDGYPIDNGPSYLDVSSPCDEGPVPR